jgi:hypothetical protein
MHTEAASIANKDTHRHDRSVVFMGSRSYDGFADFAV